MLIPCTWPSTSYRKVVRQTRAHAGKGPDSLGKSFALALPAEGWHDITSILQLVLGLGILPLTFLKSFIALIRKPVGGLRPIALLAMTYRWLLKVYRPMVSAWDREVAPPWDFSAPGTWGRPGSLRRGVGQRHRHVERQILSRRTARRRQIL